MKAALKSDQEARVVEAEKRVGHRLQRIAEEVASKSVDLGIGQIIIYKSAVRESQAEGAVDIANTSTGH